ncbi:MAG: hypothetical protein HY720_31685 [Planctomycetes bacterium]|nr:hypothetical protein [Planctomycetota bacterium]
MSPAGDPNRPRFPGRGERGFYEVWYLTFVHRASGTGYWVRYTVDFPAPGGAGEPRAGVWFASFDRERPQENLAVQEFFAGGELRAAAPPGIVELAGNVLASGRARGRIERKEGACAWDLTWPAGGATFLHFPSLLYRGPFPRTKVLSPALDVPFSGWVETPRGRIALDGEPGEQTHLWGTRHAHRWAWGHCNAFEGAPGAVFEGLTAQVLLGSLKSPFLSLAHARAGGEAFSFNRIPGLLAHRARIGPGPVWTLSAMSSGVRLSAELRCRPEDLIQVEYHDPDGARVHCYNTEVADATVVLSRRRAGAVREIERLESRGTAALEFAGPAGDTSWLPR